MLPKGRTLNNHGTSMDYVTFTESIRKGQVIQGMGNATSKPLAPFYRQQEWAIPSFAFGRELWPQEEGEREPLYLAAIDWASEGRLRLPFPECVFLEEYPDTHVVVRAMEQDNGSIVLQPYSRAKAGDSIKRACYAIAFGGELDMPTRTSSGLPTRIFFDIEENAAFDADYIQEWANIFVTRAIKAAFVLTLGKPNDECIVLTPDKSSALERANRGRAAAGRPILPPTQTLRIRHEAIHRVMTNRPGHHSPKSPHLRRGHERRYRDGKVIWIEATSIKGGGNIVPKQVILKG